MLSIFSRICVRSGTFRPAILLCLALTGAMFGAQDSRADDKKPNILVIFGDDIGQSNISRYTHGLMGMKTPNIDSIGEHGMTFTDYYAETAARPDERHLSPDRLR